VAKAIARSRSWWASAVLADLEGDGGQVDQRPGGVVLEPGRDRHLERLFQLGSPALVTLVEVD